MTRSLMQALHSPTARLNICWQAILHMVGFQQEPADKFHGPGPGSNNLKNHVKA
jgi:hypothetical protein